MTIIRDGRNAPASKTVRDCRSRRRWSQNCVRTVESSGNPDDVIAVDRDMDDLRTVNVVRRTTIGYPMFTRDADEFDDADCVDTNDLFRLKTLIGKPPIVFVMGWTRRNDHIGTAAGGAPNCDGRLVLRSLR